MFSACISTPRAVRRQGIAQDGSVIAGHNEQVKETKYNNHANLVGFYLHIPINLTVQKPAGKLPEEIANAIEESDVSINCESDNSIVSCSGGSESLNMTIDNSDQFESSLELTTVPYYNYAPPPSEYNIKETATITPNKLKVSCDEKDCVVMDENNQPVNSISVNQAISVDKATIEKYFQKERKAQEEAKKLRAQQAKQCPPLYEMWFGRGRLQYSNDIILKKNWADKWEAYECDYWLESQLNYY
jgi:hypothetical protein